MKLYTKTYSHRRVNNINPNTGTATVFFIDYGNLAPSSIDKLRVITKEFVRKEPDIVKIPGLAMECSLSHIQPNR